jgi:hypothetical protein
MAQTLDVTNLLSVIRDAESSDNYDIAIKSGTGEGEDLDLTSLTVGQVRAIQRKREKTHGSAVGAYQIIDDTLDYLVNSEGFSNSDIFNKETQDRMAVALLERRGLTSYLEGEITPQKFLGNVAKEWAGIPTLKNKSAWEGVAGNKARTDYQTVLDALPRYSDKEETIPLLVQRAVNAGATIREVATVLNLDELSVDSLLKYIPPAPKVSDKDPLGEGASVPPKPDLSAFDFAKATTPVAPGQTPLGDGPPTPVAPSLPTVAMAPSVASTNQTPLGAGPPTPVAPSLPAYSDISDSLNKKLTAVADFNAKMADYAGRNVSRIEQQSLEELNSDLSPELQQKFRDIRQAESDKAIGVVREISGGLALQAADELEALYQSSTKGTSYAVELDNIKKARDEFTYLNPGLSAASEALGVVPGAVGNAFLLTRLGIVGIPTQATIEAGTYGFMSGDSLEERAILGASSAALGYGSGRFIDYVFNPSLVTKSTNADTLHIEQTKALQEAASANKTIVRPDAQLTDNQVVDQLIIRETEFLAETLGRQGADVTELGNFNIRLLEFGSEMGVPNKQLNKIVSKNKRIADLRKSSTRGFVDADDLNAYRRDLLDNVAGRLALDVGRSIPAAQSTLVKLRRLGSPLATLAETVVGKSFSESIIRGMNRVVRGQSELDHIWKGMEQLRSLANDVKFNDLLLDAVNAQRIGTKAASSALQEAKEYADKEIGKGAGARLQRFFDDNVEFNARYRREVTKGPLSNIWMHSAVKSSDQDMSLRVNRARAAAKAEDDASKQRKRKAMAKEREKDLEDQLEYVNIFDSHWRWQRETLTRMELGKQLGLRTSGAPLAAPNLKDLPKALRKKVEKGEMTPLEALAKIEQDTFKLFDEKIVKEALSREGLSDLQIKNAIEILDDLGVNANRGMAQELEIVRSLGYVGTIANPYGALMNVHDLFNASFELGVGNVLKALFSRNGIRFTADEVGLGQQVYGDFVRRSTRGDPDILGSSFIQKIAEGSEDLLKWSMKWSGFSDLDKFGKGRIMGASFNKAKQDIRSGKFDEKWKHSFSRGEIDQLKRDIAANNTTSELVRDLVMFDLFRLQPINPAAQTSFGLANPNARLFYMLKGFAIKQFDLMERRIIREWQQGNKVESLSNAMKYLVLSGGGYGVVNEGRQVIKGDVPNPEEAAIAALYQVGSVFTFGAMGANEYGFDKFMEDPVHAVALNLMPPVGATLPASVLEDVSDAVTKGDLIPDETIEALPIVGKTIKGTGILDD